MRAIRVLAGMAGVLFVVAACGQASNLSTVPAGGSSGPSPTSATSSPSPSENPGDVPSQLPPKVPPSVPLPGRPTMVPPEGGTLLPKNQVDTSGLPSYYTFKEVWSLNGGRSLTLYAMGRDSCTGVQAIVTEQSQNAVRIQISPMDVPQGGQPDGGGMCAQMITPRMVTVDLKVPLGNRTVYLSAQQ
jgi:hypothetical protein